MLDLITTTIEIDHKPFGSIRNKVTEGGQNNTKRLSKRVYIKGVPVLVTSLNDGTHINIRCSPLKVLQGHNVFGTNSLKRLWTRLIVGVLNELQVKHTPSQLKLWLRGEFDVEEIHITHRFPVDEYPTVQKVICHIRRYTSDSLTPSSIPKGVGVTLRAPHHQAEWLFYDKHQEFVDKRTKERKYLCAVMGEIAISIENRLSRLASKSIRAELKLKKSYLKKHSLDRGNAWTSSMAIQVFKQELSLLSLGKLPALPDLPKVYAAIDSPKLRSIVILWANGEDMAKHYASSTLRKYRKEVMNQLGIDILRDQPVLETASVNLAEVFDPSKMLVGFPMWARKYPELVLR